VSSRYADLPVVALWQRYTDWMREYRPRSRANLAPGAHEADFERVADVIGHELPLDVRALLSVNDGQVLTGVAAARTEEADAAAFPGTCLLSTRLIIDEWHAWRDLGVDGDDGIGETLAPGVVKPHYANRHWVPLLNATLRSDYFGLDFDPGPEGHPGQVINFGRDEECHYVAAPDLTGLLEIIVPAVIAATPVGARPSGAADGRYAEEGDVDGFLAHFCEFATVYRLRCPS
jgi:cell wall assembly regulator SMI1